MTRCVLSRGQPIKKYIINSGAQCKLEFSFQITFGHVGENCSSKTQPRFIHKR